jgi:putative transposase
VRICRLFGITRQAYYSHFWNQQAISIEEELVLEEVKQIRKFHPVIGTRKLLVMLQSFLLEHQIKMGRDALFDLLAANKLLVKRTRRRAVTTWSSHWLRKYPNLIRQYQVTKANQLWVSDITYWPMKKGFLYASFITDAYTHKIVGYSVSESLDALSPIKALKMALNENTLRSNELIHHSDRGVQYCCTDYVNLLQDNNIQISMTENGDPLENAVAERVNGIIKQEYLEHCCVNNITEAEAILEQAVTYYNIQRPHMSCGWLTPALVHDQNLSVNRKWKNYYKRKSTMNQL